MTSDHTLSHFLTHTPHSLLLPCQSFCLKGPLPPLPTTCLLHKAPLPLRPSESPVWGLAAPGFAPSLQCTLTLCGSG